jgi:hypothetical protein
LLEADEAVAVGVASSSLRCKANSSSNNRDRPSVGLAFLGAAAADEEAIRVEAATRMHNRQDRDNPKDKLVPDEVH